MWWAASCWPGASQVQPHWAQAAPDLQQYLTGQARAAGTSSSVLINLPGAALVVGLLYWLLHQQAGKLKAAQSQADRRRSSMPHPGRTASTPAKQRPGEL